MVMIKLFEIDDRDFNSNGKIIIEPYSLVEYKETSLNGWFIEMEIPIKYDEAIKEGMIAFVETKSKGGQPFRISNPQRSHKILTIKAHHITFDSSDYVLEDVRPTNMSAAGALKYVNDRTDTTSPFKTNSNVSGSNTAYFINKSLFEALDTIQERWGGVYDCDKFQIELRETVGTDRGDTIMYGKNLEGLSVYEDWSNVVTKLLPVGFDGLRLPETYLYSEIDYGKPYTKVVKFETELEDEERTEQALLKELRANAWSYLLENEVPKISYELESNIEQELGIGDVIHVKHPVVNIQTEVIAYEYNILTRRTQKITFGNYKRSVNKKVNTIKEIIGKIEQKTNEFDVVIKDQSDLINSLNKFGYVYQDDNQIMIVDSLPKETAKKVWRWNAAGLGYSKNGIEGPFEYAWTMDGAFNTNFISANSIMTNQLHSEVGSSLDISSNKSIQMLVSNLSEGNLILNLNGTLDMANNTYPYYIFNQNGLQTVFQTIQQTRHMGSPIFRVVQDRNSVSGYSKQYEFKGKALATEYAYIVPDTIYSYRCKRTNGNTPMDVYVVEYDGNKKQIKRTKFTLDGQNMIESFSFTPAQMTMWARLEFFNNIEEPFNIAEEMFVRGEPVKWSEDANEVRFYSKSLFEQLAHKIVLGVDVDGNIVQMELSSDPKEGSKVLIKADQIKLEGYTSINGGFEVLPDGRVKMVDAEVSGTIEMNRGKVGNMILENGVLTVSKDYYSKKFVSEDLDRISKILTGEIIATDSDFVNYDIDRNGVIDLTDMVMVKRSLLGHETNPVLIKRKFSIGEGDGELLSTIMVGSIDNDMAISKVSPGLVQGDNGIFNGLYFFDGFTKQYYELMLAEEIDGSNGELYTLKVGKARGVQKFGNAKRYK